MRGIGRRPLVAGNWKMNGLAATVGEIEGIIAGARTPCGADRLPARHLHRHFRGRARGSRRDRRRIATPGQAGPTGDLSAEMLEDAGARAVIVGHSERRPITARPTPKCGRRRKRRGGRDCGHRLHGRDQATSAPPADPRELAGGQLDARSPEARCRLAGGRLRAGVGDRHRVAPRPTADVAEVHRVHPRATGGDSPPGEAIRILYGGSVKPSNARS